MNHLSIYLVYFFVVGDNWIFVGNFKEAFFLMANVMYIGQFGYLTVKN